VINFYSHKIHCLRLNRPDDVPVNLPTPTNRLEPVRLPRRPWNTPHVVAPKPTPPYFRLAQDFRRINKILQPCSRLVYASPATCLFWSASSSASKSTVWSYALKSFLGVTGYQLRRFCPFGECWNEECQQAYDSIIKMSKDSLAEQKDSRGVGASMLRHRVQVFAYSCPWTIPLQLLRTIAPCWE